MASSISGIKFTARHPDTDKPLSFGKVYTYESGTTSPKVTYSDEDKVAVNTNPVILDANGQADICLEGKYRLRVCDSSDVQIDIIDPVSDAATQAKDFVGSIAGFGTAAIKDVGENYGNVMMIGNGSWLGKAAPYPDPLIPLEIDLNNLPEKMKIWEGTGLTNAPVSTKVVVQHIPYQDGTKMQVCYSNADQGVYTRSYNGTTWSAWYKLAKGESVVGFKNYIINGNFDVWQYGTTFTSTIGGNFTADRWQLVHTGTAVTAAQVPSANGSGNYALQINGAAGNTSCLLSHKIESVNAAKLVSKTITVSVNSVVNSGTNTVKWIAYYPSTADNFTSTTQIATGTFNVGSYYTKNTFTISNLPAGVANGLQIIFLPNNGGAFTSGFITFLNVQLEEGSVGTSFEQRPYGLELSLCQRYYWPIPAGYLRMYGYGLAGNAFSYSFKLPTKMRVTPTVDFNVATTSNCSAGAGIATNEFLVISPTITANGAFIIVYSGTAQYASAEIV